MYVETRAGTGLDVMTLPLDPAGPAKPLLYSPFDERNADVSPDGRWIAYTSNEMGGVTNVFVRPFPAVDTGKWQVTTTGGSTPLWSKNGRELICALSQPGGPSAMAAFPIPVIPAGASFIYGKPEVFFSFAPYFGSFGRTYDISRDGQRFLMLKTGTTSALHPSITVVSH